MRWVMALMLVAGCMPALADAVWMNDGSIRTGVVVGKNDDEVLLRVDREGIKATIGLPAKSVAKIIKSAPTPAGATATTAPFTSVANADPIARTLITPPPPLEQKVSRSTVWTTELPPTRGFLIELAASAAGGGPDDPRRLPDDLRELWNDALRKEARQKPAELLDALRALDEAFLPIPGGMERLEAVCQRERKESFGVWMARVHWQLVADKYAGGKFEFGEVREVERRPLIGMLKEKTAPALEPLKSYFPPLDPKTGKKEPFKPSQLQGINVSNALEIKKQASFASAVLLAQLKLEPEMQPIDKLYLGQQLTTVRRILSRAVELEPAARAAAEKASSQKK